MTKNADAFESAFWWSAFATARAWTFFSSRGALISFKHTHHHETTTTTHLFPRLLVPSLGTRANPSSQPRLSADYPRYPGLRSSTRTPCSSLGTSRAVLKSDIESPFFSLMDISNSFPVLLLLLLLSRRIVSNARSLFLSFSLARARTHTHTHTHTLSLSLAAGRGKDGARRWSFCDVTKARGQEYTRTKLFVENQTDLRCREFGPLSPRQHKASLFFFPLSLSLSLSLVIGVVLHKKKDFFTKVVASKEERYAI